MILTSGGFKIIRERFGRLDQGQVNQLNLLVSEMDKDKSISYAQAAYILATAWHEVGPKLLPIKEWGEGKKLDYGRWMVNSKGEKYCYKNDRRKEVYTYAEYPHLYFGRGFVQLTWYSNYEKAGNKLGVDFLSNPDLVMQTDNAIKIMIIGMKEGWFTGHKLSHHINQSRKDYENARRIINGTDKAKKIAGYAGTFERALRSL